MRENQVTKTLFKKLSALRATLSDEEQYLLDSLLVGSYRLPKNYLNGSKTTDDSSSKAESPNIRLGIPPPDNTKARPPLRITFDQELEHYIIE